MGTITIIRDAKCKDCKFIKPLYNGKRKYHECSNKLSNYYGDKTTLNTLVCKNWEIKYDN